MHSSKMTLALCVAMLLATGCKQEAPAQEAAAANAGKAIAEPSAAAGAAGTDEDMADAPQAMTEQDGIRIALSMLAAVEQCGLSTPAESAASLAKIKLEAAKKGVSTTGIDAQYKLLSAQVKAGALANPAKLEESCTQLRAMHDPAQVKKMQEAAAAAEKWAAEMEAKAAGKAD